MAVRAQPLESPTLAREQILIVPVALQASPAQQTVPKNTATVVNVTLARPPGTGTALVPADALVFAQIRGPAFVSQVTSRPLTAQEIKDKGIVVDQTNFKVVNFTAAFGVEGRKVSVDFPMVLPTQRGASAPAAVPALTLPPLQQTTATVSAAQLPQLQLALQVPSVSVSGLLLRVEDQELEDKFLIPSFPAAIIIPGNIAYLNQFFSVLLMVSNVAPGQSSLVVRDIKAEIVLPAGKDTVPDTSDDPLRMAVVGTPPAPTASSAPRTTSSSSAPVRAATPNSSWRDGRRALTRSRSRSRARCTDCRSAPSRSAAAPPAWSRSATRRSR